MKHKPLFGLAFPLVFPNSLPVLCYGSFVLELSDKFRGCLLGLAVGDSLGVPLDGLTATEAREQIGTVAELRGGGRQMLLPGQVSNPTRQMLCVLESYTETGTFDPHDIAERLLEWYRRGQPEVCASTRGACESLQQGYNFERAGHSVWLALDNNQRVGCHSLVRTAPTGLLHYFDEVHLIGESRVVCGITHFDERCKLACACFGLAISHLLMADAHSLVDELVVFGEPRNPVVGHSLKEIPHIGPADLNTSGFVQDSLQAALWVTVFCDSFEEGLVLLAKNGGYASTVCAIAGALLGARFGVEAIPKRWLDLLSKRDQIDSSAHRLYELSERSD